MLKSIRAGLGPWSPLVVCLVLSACPYDNPVPLDAPKAVSLDQRLLGRWVARHDKEKDGGFTEFEFFAFNEREYLVTTLNREPFKRDEVDHYRAYPTVVGGRTFLNCRDLRQQESYVFAVYELSDPETLAVSFVSDDAMKPAGGLKTSAALRAYVEKHVADKGFFEPLFELKRTADSERK